MKKNRLTKVQRKVKAQNRRTLTNAEKFEARQKNAARLAKINGEKQSRMKKYLDEAEKEILAEENKKTEEASEQTV